MVFGSGLCWWFMLAVFVSGFRKRFFYVVYGSCLMLGGLSKPVY